MPWTQIENSKIEYSTVYNFTVEVCWHKQDGSNETRSTNIAALWYNLAQPQFYISAIPSQPLVSSREPSVFEIIGQNFDS